VPFAPVSAGDWFKSKPAGEKTVQMSSIFTNDFLGDGDDRWRTGSLDISLTFGGGDLRELPTKAWDRYQVRLRSEIIAPANLTTPSPTDRRYAGILGLGLFTHFQKQEYDIYYGGEVVFVGESTGLGSLQRSIHEELDTIVPSAAVLNNQIPNAIYPTLHAGISKSFRGQNSLLRPFAEMEVGAETLVRIGSDAIFGSAMLNDFLLRDSVSGQLVSHSKADGSKGFGFLVGADAAYVADSSYLDNSGVSQLESFRPRARAGMIYQTQKFDAFYGVTWLGKEFETQTENQVVGSLNFRFSF
jgi:hypothetical protein